MLGRTLAGRLGRNVGVDYRARGLVTQARERVKGSSVLFGVPIAVTFSLGVWQVYRLDRKLKLIEDRKNRLSSPELTVDELGRHDDLEYRRITLEGRFVHTREMLVGPRAAPKQMPTPVMQWGGSSGLQVVTPFVLHNGEEVLVNRGWVPQRLCERSKRDNAAISPHPFLKDVDGDTITQEYHDDAEISTLVTIHGIIRTADAQNRFTPSNRPDQNEWFYIDPMTMHGTRHVVELLTPLPKPGWPYTRTPEEISSFRTTPTTHITYATTWFSLTFFLTLISRLKR